MSKIDHGGSAYPVPEYSGDHGMTLRQWYAGKALTSLPADVAAHCPADAARYAFNLADAMIAHESRERRERREAEAEAEAKEKGQ